MTEKSRVISLASSFAGFLLAVGVMTVFTACGPKDDGTWMNCHNAQIYVALCGAGMTGLLAIAAFTNNKSVRMILLIAGLILSVITFMIPGNLVHLCILNNMHCQAELKPFTRAMTFIIALLALWDMLQAVMKMKDSRSEAE